jgi:hypothetical protein
MIRTGDVVTYGRDKFVNDVWSYETGQHLTILGATRNGKTHLVLELLEVTASEELQAVILVMKPRDPLLTRWASQHKKEFKTIRDWPPTRITGIATAKPHGYILWPKATGDPDLEDARHARIFQRAIRSCYDKGDKIIFADEGYSLESEYGLSRDLVRVETKGGSMGCGLWLATQRPAFINRWAYQAQHLFLSNDPDKDTQKRYGDIGAGIDPDLVRALTAQLTMYQWVYIHRDDRTLCIVDAN